MKRLLFVLFACFSQVVLAQEAPYFEDMRVWSLNGEDSVRHIFADTAFIRISPDTRQLPIDTLLAGDDVTITQITDKSLTLKGLKGPWLQVRYIKDGITKDGYIWQGLIGCSPMRRGDVKFIYAVDRRADSSYVLEGTKEISKRFLIRLKVVQKGKILASGSLITPDDESASYSTAKVMSGMGLTGVQNIITLTFSGEACGIPTYDYYFGWTKEGKLVRFPDKTNVGDAGAYYHSETFTFPNEKNGKPDMIVWNMTTEEATDNLDKDGNNIMATTEKGEKQYVWDPVNAKVSLIAK